MKTFTTLTTVAFALCLSSAAHAQVADAPVNSNDGTGYIGASILLNSEYLGSADEEIRALPYLSFDNVKGFTLFGTTLRYRALDIGTGQGLDKWSLRAGPAIGFQGGRDSDESENLNGFDDVGGSIPLGGYIRSTIGPVGLGLNVGQDIIGGHDGLTADASIGTFYRVGNFAVQPTATISWADNTSSPIIAGSKATLRIALSSTRLMDPETASLPHSASRESSIRLSGRMLFYGTVNSRHQNEANQHQ